MMGGGVWPDREIFPPEAFEAPDPEYVSTLDRVVQLIKDNREDEPPAED